MKYNLIFFLLTIVFVSGCCMFMPCHPGTWAFGYVTDMEGNPIKNAKVKLYSSNKFTNSDGCFNFALADALPFTFSAEAVGYEPIVEVSREIGYYFISVKLAPVNSKDSSKVIWKKISKEEYSEAEPCS